MVDPDIEASSHMEINPSQNSTIIADGPTQTGLSFILLIFIHGYFYR